MRGSAETIRARRFVVYGFCLIAFLANCIYWVHARTYQALWANVPPVPSARGAGILAMGDSQYAYRALGLMIQNLGDSGGKTRNLADYDYERLGRWFHLEDSLDPHSNHIPLLASYYFGGTPEPEDLDPVIEYLAEVGQRTEGEKWRWLAQAVYLARFVQEDQDKALDLALKLSAMNDKIEGLPGWTRQMPAFVLLKKGERDAAYDLMIGILKTDADKLHPNEVNFMREYICDRILEKEEATLNPLCDRKLRR